MSSRFAFATLVSHILVSSLKDVASKLHLDSTIVITNAESIVTKAIWDGIAVRVGRNQKRLVIFDTCWEFF